MTRKEKRNKTGDALRGSVRGFEKEYGTAVVEKYREAAGIVQPQIHT